MDEVPVGTSQVGKVANRIVDSVHNVEFGHQHGAGTSTGDRP
jgi:hypothetical protein